MKRNCTIILLAILLAGCDPMDVLHMFDKKREYAFVTNTTGLDVEMTRLVQSGPADTTYHIGAGQEVEIPVTEHWSMSLHYIEYDTVRFVFSDGSVIYHCARVFHDIYGYDSIVYTPSENNILRIDHLSSDPDDNSWTCRNIEYNRYRYDYYIR